MTITYTGRVANANLFVFSRLLVHWKGSIYKLVYKEMLIFCILYATLSLTYRIALNDEQKKYVAVCNITDAFFRRTSISQFPLGFFPTSFRREPFGWVTTEFYGVIPFLSLTTTTTTTTVTEQSKNFIALKDEGNKALKYDFNQSKL